MRSGLGVRPAGRGARRVDRTRGRHVQARATEMQCWLMKRRGAIRRWRISTGHWALHAYYWLPLLAPPLSPSRQAQPRRRRPHEEEGGGFRNWRR